MIHIPIGQEKYIPDYRKIRLTWNSLQKTWQYHRSKWRNYSRTQAPNDLRLLDNTYQDKGGNSRDIATVNPVARQARDIFSAGLMSLMTNKSTPWYRLKLTDSGNFGETQADRKRHSYLKEMDTLTREGFGKTNYYQTLANFYKDIGTFGTGAFMKEYDLDKDVLYKHLAPGSFMLDVDWMGLPKHFQTAMPMTVNQIMARFFKKADGTFEKEMIPSALKRLIDGQNNLDHEYKVVYSVHPNEMKMPNSSDEIAGANWIGTFYLDQKIGTGGYEKDDSYGPEPKKGKESWDDLLEFQGHTLHPVTYCPWHRVQNDPYGYDHPGEYALKLINQIQHGEKRGGQAVDYGIMPHFIGSSRFKFSGKRVDNLPPGGFTPTNDRLALEFGLKPIHNTNFRLDHNEQRISRFEKIINDCYMVNYFLRISMIDQANVSATQINETSQERLLVLGPTYNVMEPNVFETSIEFQIEKMYENNNLPEPPEELLNENTGELDLGVEYVSVLAKALKIQEVKNNDQYLALMTAHGERYPEMAKKVKGVGFANDFAELMGVRPKNVLTDDEVAQLSRMENQRRAEDMQMQREMLQAKAGKDMAGAKLQDGSSLLDKRMEDAA